MSSSKCFWWSRGTEDINQIFLTNDLNKGKIWFNFNLIDPNSSQFLISWAEMHKANNSGILGTDVASDIILFEEPLAFCLLKKETGYSLEIMD